jgi:hypothetical protein
LEAAGITNVEQLTTHTTTELIGTRRFSPTALYKIVCCLNQRPLPATDTRRS